jgi:uncharacterized phage protein (TIGR02218 family)
VYGGLTYAAASGYTATAIQSTAGMAVDNLDLMGVLDSPAITIEDLIAGAWDGAQIEIERVNWRDLTIAGIKDRKGTLGEVSAGDVQYTAELRGMAQKLQQPTGRRYDPLCDADLGDARCAVALGPLTVTGTITSVTDRRTFTDTGRAEASGFFEAGKLTWTAGANNGRSMEVRTFAGGVFILQLPMPADVAVGDTYSVYRGCKKRFTEDCVAVFANGDNFRGFPSVAGTDAMLAGL